MTKFITLLAVLLNGALALAAGGPLTEQQKKDFMDEFKSVERIERLYADALERKTSTSDEVYEKMLALVQQACKFVENTTTKDNVETITLESTEVGCPVAMKLIGQSKEMGDGAVATAAKVVYQAGDLMKALNDVIELNSMTHGNSVETKTEKGSIETNEENGEGYVISQKNGRSDFTTHSHSTAEISADGNIGNISGEFTLNTHFGDIEVEMKITYKYENGVFTKEIYLNGEKIEVEMESELFKLN